MDAVNVVARQLASSHYGRDGASDVMVLIAYTSVFGYGGAAPDYGR